MSDYPLLKDSINHTMVDGFARRLQAVYSAFNADAFREQATTGLTDLALKARAVHVADALHTTLPQPFPQAAAVLLQILDWGEPDHSTFRGFHVMVMSNYVERYGLDHFEAAMHANYEITRRWSSEFAMRPFITRYPAKTWAVLEAWVHDDDEHVRRLVSECTRPRLPWATRLNEFIADPGPLFALLSQLRHDPSAYVRRSVANNLNDISKDHPEEVIKLLRGWSTTASDATRWIMRHALRSLVKQGHPEALALLGYGGTVALVTLTLTPESIRLGEPIYLSATLQNDSDEDARLMIDMVVHFVKKNGSTAPKVFKLTQMTAGPGEMVLVDKRLSFRQINTRKHYSGQHLVALQVNGQVLGQAAFHLTVE